jgi:nucleotide-binding universal stress UspA family protein
MKILLAADGSSYTKKALAFLVANENLQDALAEVLVFHVQAPLTRNVVKHIGSEVAADYYSDNAKKVLQPIETFLTKRGIPYRTAWTVGVASDEILKAARKQKAHLIVMGTHGRGLAGRILLGSVAQRVLAESDVPVLLVK